MTTTDRLPTRALPLLYLGTAHVSLALAFLFAGLIGMVGHFWIQQYAGMAWSVGTVASGVMHMTVQIAVRVRLPGFVLSNVFAHAHLAALGWATMMVVGVGYRLLPMTFPSKIPSGPSLWLSAILLETGVLGLFTTLLLHSAWMIAFGVTIVAGLAVFMAHVVWMRRHLAAKPPGVQRIQFGLLHAASAALSLIVASAIGVTLLVMPASPTSRRAQASSRYSSVEKGGLRSSAAIALPQRRQGAPSR